MTSSMIPIGMLLLILHKILCAHCHDYVQSIYGNKMKMYHTKLEKSNDHNGRMHYYIFRIQQIRRTITIKKNHNKFETFLYFAAIVTVISNLVPIYIWYKRGGLELLIIDKRGITREQALDTLQTVLDFVGVIPGVGDAADMTNAVISLARGNYEDAAPTNLYQIENPISNRSHKFEAK